MRTRTHSVSIRLDEPLFVKIQAEVKEKASAGLCVSDIVRQALLLFFAPAAQPSLSAPAVSPRTPNMSVLHSPIQENKDEKTALQELRNW